MLSVYRSSLLLSEKKNTENATIYCSTKTASIEQTDSCLSPLRRWLFHIREWRACASWSGWIRRLCKLVIEWYGRVLLPVIKWLAQLERICERGWWYFAWRSVVKLRLSPFLAYIRSPFYSPPRKHRSSTGRASRSPNHPSEPFLITMRRSPTPSSDPMDSSNIFLSLWRRRPTELSTT